MDHLFYCIINPVLAGLFICAFFVGVISFLEIVSGEAGTKDAVFLKGDREE